MVNKEISNSLIEKHLKFIHPNTKIREKCKEITTLLCKEFKLYMFQVTIGKNLSGSKKHNSKLKVIDLLLT